MGQPTGIIDTLDESTNEGAGDIGDVISVANTGEAYENMLATHCGYCSTVATSSLGFRHRSNASMGPESA